VEQREGFGAGSASGPSQIVYERVFVFQKWV